MKAQGTVHATERLDQEQEWLCTLCGKWFPSQPACIGHQSSQQGPDEKLGLGLAVPDVSDRVPFAGAFVALLLRCGARRCVQAARHGELPTLPAEEVERLDGADAAESRRRARQGISRPDASPDTNSNASSDASSDAGSTSDCAGRLKARRFDLRKTGWSTSVQSPRKAAAGSVKHLARGGVRRCRADECVLSFLYQVHASGSGCRLSAYASVLKPCFPTFQARTDGRVERVVQCFSRGRDNRCPICVSSFIFIHNNPHFTFSKDMDCWNCLKITGTSTTERICSTNAVVPCPRRHPPQSPAAVTAATTASPPAPGT